MKKIITIFLLCTCILFTGLFCLLYYSFNIATPENVINQTFRKKVIALSPLKYIFRLHQVGDSRYEYMTKPTLPLSVNIYTQDEATLSSETIEPALREIFRQTHKFQKNQLKEFTLSRDIPKRVNDQDIDAILATHEAKRSLFPKDVPLNIFVLHEYERYPSYAGLVVDDHSIFLFEKILRSVSDHQDSPKHAEISTILHEFGHLLGAGHIQTPDCLLTEKIENIDLLNRPSVFRDTFCPEDITEINSQL